MRNVLLVSSGEAATSFLKEMLFHNHFEIIEAVSTGGEARRMTVERNFDLCIINAPLSDEAGDRLAVQLIGERVNQVILIVRREIVDEITAKVEDYGVFTVEKPINRSAFWSALKMTEAAFKRLNAVNTENSELKRKLDNVKLISRAKIILIETKNFNEDEAHKYILNEAMNSRISSLEVAKKIIKEYENEN